MENSFIWEWSNNGLLCNKRLPSKLKLENYCHELTQITEFDETNNEHFELLSKVVREIETTFYCFYKNAKCNDNRFLLIVSIVDLLNSKLRVKNPDFQYVIEIFLENAEEFIKGIKKGVTYTEDRLISFSDCCSKIREFKKVEFYPHAFLNDYNRIVSSSAFRRLQDKAQVFSLEEHDYVRTRLTHSIEVSSIAIHLANQCALRVKKKDFSLPFKMEKVLCCAAFLHDIGNPPFGHYGEDVIKNFFVRNKNKFKYTKYLANGRNEDRKIPKLKSLWNDFTKYDGNAQSFRIASTLQEYKPGSPLELTAAILGAIIKYPMSSGESSKDKFGYFYSERKIIEDLECLGVYKNSIRNPLSMLLEAADDICYLTSDFDDVVKKNLVTYEDFVFELDKINDQQDVLVKFKKDFYKYYSENRKLSFDGPFALTIRRMANDLKLKLIREVSDVFVEKHEKILSGISITDETKQICIANDRHTIELLEAVTSRELIKWIRKNIFQKYVYPCNTIIKDEVAGHEMLSYILNTMCDAVLQLNFNTDENGNFLLSKGSNEKKCKKHEKIFRLISKNFVEQFKIDTKSLKVNSAKHIYYRFRLVVDYVSGMTDGYAKEVYQALKGIR